MNVTSAEFIPLSSEDTPAAGWVMRVIIHTRNLEQRAVPVVAKTGGQPVQGLMSLFEEEGLVGFLHEMPASGDELLIGYADGPMIHTGITYDPAVS